jgi:hypothetical protein
MRIADAAAALAAVACAAPAAASAAPFNFLTWGDWGTGSALQRSNAAAINAHCAVASNCRFILSLGDQFYNGPLDTHDKRWETEFSAMYNFSCPVYAAQGNHDYAGSVAAQLAFRNDTRWATRATNYTLSFPEADLSIVVVDSPRGIPSYMSAPYGDCNELCMIQLAAVGCTNATEVPSAPACLLAHAAWLNATLAALTTRWKLVALHHPIDEGNLHFLVPAFRAHGVQAVFAGHIHNMQHNLGADGVQYFISGAGAFASAAAEGVPAVRAGAGSHAPRPLTCTAGSPCAPLRAGFFADGPGFLSVSVGTDAVAASFIHHNGTTLTTVVFNSTF